MNVITSGAQKALELEVIAEDTPVKAWIVTRPQVPYQALRLEFRTLKPIVWKKEVKTALNCISSTLSAINLDNLTTLQPEDARLFEIEEGQLNERLFSGLFSQLLTCQWQDDNDYPEYGDLNESNGCDTTKVDSGSDADD